LLPNGGKRDIEETARARLFLSKAGTAQSDWS
jgi:hypothetical protein